VAGARLVSACLDQLVSFGKPCQPCKAILPHRNAGLVHGARHGARRAAGRHDELDPFGWQVQRPLYPEPRAGGRGGGQQHHGQAGSQKIDVELFHKCAQFNGYGGIGRPCRPCRVPGIAPEGRPPRVSSTYSAGALSAPRLRCLIPAMHAFFSLIATQSDGSPLCAPLPDYAVVSASGDDALSFLHGQLTQDVTGLPPDSARLAGYCTAKGRLLATMVLWLAQPGVDTAASPDATRACALVRRDLADALVKRLSMFVLRAKAKLAIAPLHAAGITCDPAALPT